MTTILSRKRGVENALQGRRIMSLTATNRAESIQKDAASVRNTIIFPVTARRLIAFLPKGVS
jgi:hypothetical protein